MLLLWVVFFSCYCSPARVWSVYEPRLTWTVLSVAYFIKVNLILYLFNLFYHFGVGRDALRRGFGETHLEEEKRKGKTRPNDHLLADFRWPIWGHDGVGPGTSRASRYRRVHKSNSLETQLNQLLFFYFYKKASLH